MADESTLRRIHLFTEVLSNEKGISFLVDTAQPLEKVLESIRRVSGLNSIDHIYNRLGAEVIDPLAIREDDILYVLKRTPKFAQNGEWIMLIVGGQMYCLSKSTLKNCPDYETTLLAELFDEAGWWRFIVDSAGSILIDRSCVEFEEILDYIRTGEVVLDNKDECAVERLRREAKYFGMHSMVSRIDELSAVRNEFLYFDCQGVVFSTGRDTFNSCPNDTSFHIYPEELTLCGMQYHLHPCMLCRIVASVHPSILKEGSTPIFVPRDPSGSIQVQRSPQYFGIILRFHETRLCEIPQPVNGAIFGFMQELSFFDFCPDTRQQIIDSITEGDERRKEVEDERGR